MWNILPKLYPDTNHKRIGVNGFMQMNCPFFKSGDEYSVVRKQM